MSSNKEIAGTDLDGQVIYRGDEVIKPVKEKKKQKIDKKELEELKEDMKSAQKENTFDPDIYLPNDFSSANALIVAASFIILALLGGCFIFAIISLFYK